MKSIAALAATAAAATALVAVPAGADAAPPPACFETPQFAICSSDVGPLARQTLNDPVGTGQELVTITERILCYNDVEICSAT